MAAKHPIKRRRPQSGLLGKLLIIVAAAAAVVVGVMIFFKVQTLSVVGNQRYSAEQVISASGIAVGENLMAVSKADAAQGIHKKLPYVQDVRIDRRLPDTVLIEIVECEAVAVIRDEAEGKWLINAQCKVLEQATEQTLVDVDGLTLVEGALAVSPTAGEPLALTKEEQLSALKSLLGALEKTVLLPKVQSLQLEHTYELVLYYDERFEVQLGGTDELDYKARYLEEIVTKQLDESKTGIIDLTLEEDGVARLITK
ncbi:MAG: FtsQ-type POTRA domain-containing protein [Ruminococcaceae bacterium]|nr:FtsQ-type POTRA domain-containing protein [Oscillospiraceae bacterium]